MKKIIFISLLVILAVATIGLLAYFGNYNSQDYKLELKSVNTFQECLDAGQPIMESYPRQCNYGGKNFVEDIGNELQKADLIRLDNPRPNQKITTPLIVAGEARGNWFFEASFPVTLYDSNNNLLGTGIATAQGDWMTTNFVPFYVSMTFSTPTTPTGSLILKKDNPSGLPEHDDQLIVPVLFQ